MASPCTLGLVIAILSFWFKFFSDWMFRLLQNMYAQLLPLALPAPPMPGMGGSSMGGGFAPPPPMGGMGMPPMPPFGMPPMPPMGSY